MKRKLHIIDLLHAVFHQVAIRLQQAIPQRRTCPAPRGQRDRSPALNLDQATNKECGLHNAIWNGITVNRHDQHISAVLQVQPLTASNTRFLDTRIPTGDQSAGTHRWAFHLERRRRGATNVPATRVSSAEPWSRPQRGTFHAIG
ncbi:hypothetical protein [Shinella zoogloeoides]|uniref:hypothetical protein n=1 Tax=Shinella zoogloeoides TaxID=352475 RepID=UPI00299DF2D0|nr:hypothetical protein [Shinella zoogloeoides]